jgi:hypothetical protein
MTKKGNEGGNGGNVDDNNGGNGLVGDDGWDQAIVLSQEDQGTFVYEDEFEELMSSQNN